MAAAMNPSGDMNDGNRLRRFMCIGLEAGNYSPLETPYMPQYLTCINRLIEEGKGEEVVATIVKFVEDQWPRKERAVIFALAMCARSTDKDTKTAAYKAMPELCNTPSRLFSFVEFCENISGNTSGWGRAHRNAISKWYTSKPAMELATLVTKFVKRGGWSHADLLKLAHVKATDDGVGTVFKYVFKGIQEIKKDIETEGDNMSSSKKSIIKLLDVIETVKHSHDAHQVARLVEEHHFTLEYIPTWLYKNGEVWNALLQDMPVRDIIKKLGHLSAIKVLEDGSQSSRLVVEKLKNENLLRAERIHPIELLIALKVYESGKEVKIKNKAGEKETKIKYSTNSSVIDTLKAAYHNSFKFLTATSKRYLMAIDVNDLKPYGGVRGTKGISPVSTAACLAMSVMRTEEKYEIVAFSQGITPVNLSPNMEFEDVCKAINDIPKGGTDPALPILWSMDKKKTYDVFMVVTDCISLSNGIPPEQAIKKYREIVGVDDAKFIIIALTSQGFVLASPNDSNMLDIAGFDPGVPQLINRFVSGKL